MNGQGRLGAAYRDKGSDFWATQVWYSSLVLRAGHSWEGDDPEARERTVDHSRPRILAACTLGAENSDKLMVGRPACSGMRLTIYDPGESSQNEDSRTKF